MNTVAEDKQQIPLLDLSGQELNIMFVDENQPLFIPNNPLHWKAHKLQVAIARMDKISQTQPGQFNAVAYFAALDKLTECLKQINEEKSVTSGIQPMDAGTMAEGRNEGAAGADSQIQPISMDLGV